MAGENENNVFKRGMDRIQEAWNPGEFAQNTKEAFTDLGNNFVENLGDAIGIGPQIRRLKGLLSPGAEASFKMQSESSGYSPSKDLRVKIKIPTTYLKGPAEALKVDGGVVFPFTPQIVVQSRAVYNAVTPTHNNYAFYNYTNSQLDPISIVGTFSAQNENDAKYVLGAMHALRAITKMNFGNSRDAGAPPPVCRLDGYGDYQFNNLPVVIGSFFYTLNEDVDYILAGTENKTRVPTRSEFTIECYPAFSRRDMATFDIDKFISGELTKSKGMI